MWTPDAHRRGVLETGGRWGTSQRRARRADLGASGAVSRQLSRSHPAGEVSTAKRRTLGRPITLWPNRRTTVRALGLVAVAAATRPGTPPARSWNALAFSWSLSAPTVAQTR